MFRDDYRKLMETVSPSFSLRQQTEREILEMLNLTKKQKNHIRRTVCIAVIASLLVIGAAFATVISSGILDRLFANGEPSQAALESVVRNATQVSENGLTANMDEYIFDNNTMHFAWTVSSERENDIFYTTAYEYLYSNPDDLTVAEQSVGGNYGAYGSGDIGDNTLVHLGKNHPSHSSYAGYAHNACIQDAVTMQITFRYYETDLKPADVEDALDLVYADPGDPASLALENAGQIGVGPNHLSAVNGYNAFVQAREKLVNEGMNWDEANEKALVESGLFRQIGTQELSVTLEPSHATAPRFKLQEEKRYDLSDASVILKALSVDTASTIVEYEVITDKIFDEDGVAGNGVTYILFDQNGHPLNSDCQLSMTCGQLNDREGRHVWSVSLFGNPLPESVTSITFVPTAQLQRGEESVNAYHLRMRDIAQPAQCFTVELK